MRYRIYKIGIHVLAFMVARCSLLGMYPFVVPFFMASYLQEQSSLSMFIALLFGVMSRFEGQEVLRYGIILVLLLVILNRTKREIIFSGSGQIALAAGMILWGVSMPFEYIVTGKEIAILYTLLEGVIAGCMTIVFEQGFAAMKVGTSRIFADDRRFIGLFSLMGAGVFGLPDISEPFSLVLIVTGYMILYFSYRFDAGIGIAMGSLCGVAMAFTSGKISYLVVMIAVAGLTVILKEAGKAGALLAENPHVSHCYERAPFEGFPYNVYAMFHGQSEAELEQSIGSAMSALNGPDHAVLTSLKELKKTSFVYFA